MALVAVACLSVSLLLGPPDVSALQTTTISTHVGGEQHQSVSQQKKMKHIGVRPKMFDYA